MLADSHLNRFADFVARTWKALGKNLLNLALRCERQIGNYSIVDFAARLVVIHHDFGDADPMHGRPIALVFPTLDLPFV